MPEDVKKSRSATLIKHKNSVRDRILDDVCNNGKPLLAIAESLDGDGSVCMHSEAFFEIKLMGKVCENAFLDMQGKWISVIPVSHKNGVIYCEINQICK